MAKPIHIQLGIPEPCHVPWNTMSPVDEMRRHCDSCEKVVIDFRKMTDDELVSFFSKPQGNVCGRLSSSQLNRPMKTVPVKTEKAYWWKPLLLLPLLIFSKQTKAQYIQANAVLNKDTSLLAKQDSLPINENVSVNDSVSANDTVKATITVTSIPTDSTYKFVWTPYCYSQNKDSLYPYYVVFTESGGAIAVTTGTVIQVVEDPVITIASLEPYSYPWQISPWTVGNISPLSYLYIPEYTVPNSFSLVNLNCVSPDEAVINSPKEKLKKYPIWKKLYDQLEYFQNWLGFINPEKELKINKPKDFLVLQEEEKEKPETPKPATPSSDYSIAVLPEARKNSRK